MSERNHEVIKSQQLLDEYGNIAEPGWSRKQLQQYSRTQIKAQKFRIKEWDYYLVVISVRNLSACPEASHRST